jgi:hypothetical protein
LTRSCRKIQRQSFASADVSKILPPLYGKHVAVFLKDYFEEGRILTDRLVEINSNGIQLESIFIPMHNVKFVYKLEHGMPSYFEFLHQCKRKPTEDNSCATDTTEQAKSAA